METWLIDALVLAAIVVIALLVLAGGRTRRPSAETGAKRAESESPARSTGRAEVSEELVRERAGRNRPEAQLHEQRARDRSQQPEAALRCHPGQIRIRWPAARATAAPRKRRRT